jgi:hypothetical protein
VLPTQEMIARLGERIRQAYIRRYPDWSPIRTTEGVWNATAAGLLMLHRNKPTIPIDPELYVAVQPLGSWADPWADLTQQSSLRRYRRHIRLIVTQLRNEIKDEVRQAERLIRRGASLSKVLADSGCKLSALGRFVVVLRAGRVDLAEQIRPAAERQHLSCPLYMQACRTLLASRDYPLPRPSGLLTDLVIPAGVELPCFSMN